MKKKGHHPINMVLLGPPGAGKGTQAVLIKKASDLLHISTGDMLREAVKEGSETGMEAAKYMNKGELVPDSIVTKVVIERMKKSDAGNGVILDGYPRTRAQAESLGKSMREAGKSLDLVLYFKTSEEVAIQRLSGRRVCKNCAKNYHADNMPPKIKNKCDICGGDLYQRQDDEPETVKNRLVVYEQSARDLIDYYRGKNLLREVNGDISAENLFEYIYALFQKEDLI